MHLFTLVSSIGICGLLLSACSQPDEITSRHYAGLVVGHAARLKVEIARSLTASPGKPVPQAGVLRLEPPPGLTPVQFDFGWITSSGAIIVQSNEYSVVLVQEPVQTAEGVKWNCVVHPAAAKPILCGSEYENSTLKAK